MDGNDRGDNNGAELVDLLCFQQIVPAGEPAELIVRQQEKEKNIKIERVKYASI